MLIVIKMPWTPTYNPGSSIGSTNQVTAGTNGGFNVYFTGHYDAASYKRVADNNNDHIWEFQVTRSSIDNGWLSVSNTPNHTIKWTGTQWQDVGSDHPNVITLNGTTVELYNNTTLVGSFTHPYSNSSGGTSTESVPVYQWSGSFTNNPGNAMMRWNVTGFNTDSAESIYLYDNPNMTGSAIGTRTFSASSSSSTQYGLFTPDLTKTYYIVKNQGSAIHILATKNFAKGKVCCNFW